LYTAAGSVEALSSPGCEKHAKSRDAWLTYLRQRQLTEQLGWDAGDKEYGGWGYSRGLPRKPIPGVISLPLIESNISAPTGALAALRAAGCPPDDPAVRSARSFVFRCQNWPLERKADERFDDGGFFFIYDDPVRNKAGAVGTDAAGRQRFASYGSATADGLR